MQRIKSGTIDQPVSFDFGVAGLSSFSVERSRNNSTLAPMTTPTITQIGTSTRYWLLLDEDMTIGAGNESERLLFLVKHDGYPSKPVQVELVA